MCGLSLGYVFKPPYFVDLEVYRKYYTDVTEMVSAQLFISQRFKELYDRSGLRGLVEIHRAEIETLRQCGQAKRMQLPPMPDSYIANPQPIGVATDHKLSETEFYLGREPTCSYCRYGSILRQNCFVLDESTWNGDNIFRLLSIGGTIAVDQNFKDWFDDNHFTGIKFIRAEEDSRDYAPGLTPQQYYDRYSIYEKKKKEAE